MSTVGAVVARQGLWREGTELEKMDKPFRHTCPFPSLMQKQTLCAQYRLRATPHHQRRGAHTVLAETCMSAPALLPHCGVYSCLRCTLPGPPMVPVTSQESTILDTVKHRNSPSSCHVSLCAWVRPLTVMPGMLQDLIANKVFGAQETYGAAWVWGSPWDGQGHGKQFCHLRRG